MKALMCEQFGPPAALEAVRRRQVIGKGVVVT